MNNNEQRAYARIDIGMDDGLNITHLVLSSDDLVKTEQTLQSNTGCLKTTSNFMIKVNHVCHYVIYLEGQW